MQAAGAFFSDQATLQNCTTLIPMLHGEVSARDDKNLLRGRILRN
jgi:hypothetical protein